MSKNRTTLEVVQKTKP